MKMMLMEILRKVTTWKYEDEDEGEDADADVDAEADADSYPMMILMLLLMLMLCPLTVSQGVTYVRAYHRPNDAHFLHFTNWWNIKAT